MDSSEIRKKFLDFFEKRGHKIVPSSSLIPDDPSVLLTTAGMQQFKPYFMGKADPVRDFGSLRTVSIQKAFRTSDIDEVGDESHLTFFEMMGHFSFGDYFKKETIEWTHELLTQVFHIAPERISASVFAGDEKIPPDFESYDTWSHKIPKERIKKGGREGNVWGPAGPEGPCGAANEVYVDDLEVATLVFMEYFCAKDGSLTPLPQKGVDVGWGFERLVMIVQGKKNIFETDLFSPFFQILPGGLPEREKRIIVDHLRGATFLLADGVRPSNKEKGYILRRLMRRVLVYEMKIPSGTFENIIKTVIRDHGLFYLELEREKSLILDELKKEREKFILTLSKGIKELNSAKKMGSISAVDAFRIYETFGLPYEAIKDLGEASTVNLTREQFDNEFKKHQEISRAGQEKKFGGHGLILDNGELKAASAEELEKVTRLHTATHLLNTVLHRVLGDEVSQRGSDITAERTRFDFLFPRKLTDAELKEIERLVNEAIAKNYSVSIQEMPLEEARKSGAMFFYKGKYPERVKVYTIGNEKEVFSKEFCGGPHVKNTSEIGQFKIIKEESSSAGVRRIRAVV